MPALSALGYKIVHFRPKANPPPRPACAWAAYSFDLNTLSEERISAVPGTLFKITQLAEPTLQMMQDYIEQCNRSEPVHVREGKRELWVWKLMGVHYSSAPQGATIPENFAMYLELVNIGEIEPPDDRSGAQTPTTLSGYESELDGSGNLSGKPINLTGKAS